MTGLLFTLSVIGQQQNCSAGSHSLFQSSASPAKRFSNGRRYDRPWPQPLESRRPSKYSKLTWRAQWGGLCGQQPPGGSHSVASFSLNTTFQFSSAYPLKFIFLKGGGAQGVNWHKYRGSGFQGKSRANIRLAQKPSESNSIETHLTGGDHQLPLPRLKGHFFHFCLLFIKSSLLLVTHRHAHPAPSGPRMPVERNPKAVAYFKKGINKSACNT